MNLVWQISLSDIDRVQHFVAEHESDPLVEHRKRWNLAASKPPITKNEFWRALVECLLTTQQKSGPTSAVAKFMRSRPFLLSYECIASQSDVAAFSTAILSGGGIRRSKIIGRELAANYAALEDRLWPELTSRLDSLRSFVSQQEEQSVAHVLSKQLRGIGSKQSRNLLQMLGLTRFEVPIDSRLTKWLNSFGFPVHLSAAGLADPNYYEFVSTGIQRLCEAANIYPCVLDAAVFTAADGGGWREEDFEN